MASTSAAPPVDELAALRAENERLRLELADRQRAPRRSGAVLRSIGASLLIAIAVILAPSTVIASWAATEVSNTDRFVQSLAPLSHDSAVRSYVGQSVTRVIADSIDIDRFTADAFASLSQQLDPPASTAVVALAPAAADGIRQLLGDTVQRLVDSPAFQQVWDESLAFGHRELVAILENDQTAAVVVGDNGEVGINLAPIVAEVKSRLQAADFPLADAIPAVEVTITVATVERIGELRLAYRTLLAATSVLPWVTLLALVAGILIAPSRSRAMVGAGLALLGVFAALLIALGIARAAVNLEAARLGAPNAVTESLFDALTTQVRGASLALLIVGALLAAIGVVLGRSRASLAIRSTAGGWLSSARSALDRHRIGSRTVGAFLYRARAAVWTAVAVVAAVILLVSRPLTPSVVVGLAAATAAVALLFALLERPPAAEA
jgi:hypothetical protein